MTPNPVLDAFAQHRCSAILRSTSAAAVGPAMDAAIEGGFRIVEFTLTTPDALDHISRCAADSRLVVGAGTVLSLEQAQAAVDAGARFLVSPVTDVEIIAWCRERSIVSVPGTATPTEMLRASRAGADLVKLFPGPAGGPEFVRACLGPLPFLRIFPTSGVTLENAAAYLDAGAFGLGFVNVLFDPSDLAAGRFDRVRDRAEQMVATVAAQHSAGA